MTDHKKRNVGDIIMIPARIVSANSGEESRWYDFEFDAKLENIVEDLCIWSEDFDKVEFKESPLPTEPGSTIIASVIQGVESPKGLAGLTLVRIANSTSNTWVDVNAGAGRLWYQDDQIVKWELKS